MLLFTFACVCVTTTVCCFGLAPTIGPLLETLRSLTQKTENALLVPHSFLAFRQALSFVSYSFFPFRPPIFSSFVALQHMFRGFTKRSARTGSRGYFMSYKHASTKVQQESDEDYIPFEDRETSEEQEMVHACVYIFLFPTNATFPTFSHPQLKKSKHRCLSTMTIYLPEFSMRPFESRRKRKKRRRRRKRKLSREQPKHPQRRLRRNHRRNLGSRLERNLEKLEKPMMYLRQML